MHIEKGGAARALLFYFTRSLDTSDTLERVLPCRRSGEKPYTDFPSQISFTSFSRMFPKTILS